MRILFLTQCLFLLISTGAKALTVNRLNGGMNITYVDFSIPGPSIPIELVRSYNSITATSESNGWAGIFGWGWTSLIETTLTTTPERHVVLRDGGSGNSVTFKPLKEDPALRLAFFDKVKAAYFEQKLNRKLSPTELKKINLPGKILAQLKNDPDFRMEMANRYKIQGEIPPGELLVSSEYGYQTIRFKNNYWIRDKDGITQFFDKNGLLIRQQDKNGAAIEFKYSKAPKLQLTELSTLNKTATLKFVFRQERVVEVVDNLNRKSQYEYDGIGNLVRATDSTGQVFVYKYELKKFPHLLTRVEYFSETTASQKPYREIRYDENGLITFHRDKDGVETAFTYGKSSQDPENNFWTKSITKRGKTTDELYEEFFIKNRGDGTKYLHKTETRMGDTKTSTIFTQCCGKPSQIIKNGEVSTFKYYANGLLQEKVGPKESLQLEYDPRWKKVSLVVQNGLRSNYEYDGKGNLIRATNNSGQKVSLNYDKHGRIAEMEDAERRKVTFQYNEQGKPTLISEKGTGTIRIEYDRNGRITRTETVGASGENSRKPSDVKSQEVIKRVMSRFQHLLEIIRPAGRSITG